MEAVQRHYIAIPFLAFSAWHVGDNTSHQEPNGWLAAGFYVLLATPFSTPGYEFYLGWKEQSLIYKVLTILLSKDNGLLFRSSEEGYC